MLIDLGEYMPIFISDENRFYELAKNAIECRIKNDKRRGIVKLKARTKRYLYTYIVSSDNATSAIEKLKSVCKSLKEI